MTVAQVEVVTADEICARLEPPRLAAKDYLVAIGQWPAQVVDGWAERIGVLDVGGRPRVCVDAWVRRDEVPALVRRVSNDGPGGWDVMFATAWSWAWGGASFSLWSVEGRIARVTRPGQLVVVTPTGEVPHQVARVDAEVTEKWTVHRVGVTTTAGETHWLARHHDPLPAIDFTYDGLNLLADAGWASALGKALAAALDVPYHPNDAALH